MGKRLLTKDYHKIVVNTHDMFERDFKKYYFGVIEDNYESNPDIVKELSFTLSLIIRGIECEKGQGFDLICGENEKGDNILQLGNKQVDKSYFENQLKIVELIGEIVDLRNKELKFENNAPKELKERLKDVPFPEGLDLDDLKKRVDYRGETVADFMAEKQRNLESKQRNLESIRLEIKLNKQKDADGELIEEITSQQKSINIKGFESTLEPHQIESLFEQLKGEYVDEKTNIETFNALFKSEALTDNKIYWIDKPTTRPQKANLRTLFELFLLLLDMGYLNKSDVFGDMLGRKKINTIIGNSFFDGVANDSFKNINKGNETNKPTQKTERHKKLKIIISNL